QPRAPAPPLVTALPPRTASRRQHCERGACTRHRALLGHYEREPAAERPLLAPRADSRLQQGDRLLETPLLPEELRALREEAVDRKAADGLTSELESVVHALLRLGGTPFEEEARHPEARGVPEMERLAQLVGQTTACGDVRLGAYPVAGLEQIDSAHPLHQPVEGGARGRGRGEL